MFFSISKQCFRWGFHFGQVEQLVTGLLKGLDFSAGPKTVEQLGGTWLVNF